MENTIVRKCSNCGKEFTLVLRGEDRSRENGHFYSTLCDACWEKLHGKPRGFKSGSSSDVILGKNNLEKYQKKRFYYNSPQLQRNNVKGLAADLQIDPSEVMRILRKEMGVSVKSNLQRLTPDEMSFVLEYVSQGRSVFDNLAIVAWDEFDFDGYYIIVLDDADHVDRDVLVRKCAESQYFYEDFDSAEAAAIALQEQQGAAGEIRLIKLSDFGRAVPEEETEV